MSRKPTENIDYTSRDYEAYRSDMIGFLQKKMPEYTDISQTDAGIVIIEALANGLDIISLYSDIVANDVILPTTQDRKLAVTIAECLGYIPYNQTASEYPQVFVLEKVQDKDTIISKGTVVKTKESTDLATLYFETKDDLRIPAGDLGDEKDAEGNYIHTVPVIHGTSIKQDVVGSSTGAPLQTFKLSYTNVLVDSIELYINEGKGNFKWERVNSFIDSNSESLHYTISVDDFDVCTIEFGNGYKGHIPKAYPNGITVNYRVGGGEVGNVGALIITELDTGISNVASTFNLEATVRGHNKESLDSIKENAPASFRTRDRLVTLQDYSDLLKINFYEFLDVKTTRDEDDRKLAHIFLMPRSGHLYTSSFLGSLTRFIEDRRMVGTTYDFNDYVPQSVDLEGILYVSQDYNATEVREQVEKYIREVTFKYGNFQFDDTLVKSDLESEIKNTIKGVLSFRITSPSDDIIKPTAPQNVLTIVIDEEIPENSIGSINIETISL